MIPVIQRRMIDRRRSGHWLRGIAKGSRQLFGHHLAAIWLIGLLVISIGAGLVTGEDQGTLSLGDALQGPSLTHLMGSDDLGRDVFLRFVLGAKYSLLSGALCVVLGSICGGLVGVTAGIAGGWTDAVLMRLMDAILAFPPLLLAMAVAMGLGSGAVAGLIGITVASIPWYARVVRSNVLKLRSMPFMEASIGMGASRFWLIRAHMIRHVVPVILVQASAAFGYVVMALAALSFVGLGASGPEWGTMITDGFQYAVSGQWWLGVFPGLGLMTCVVAANSLSNAVRERLDPRSATNA